MINLKQLPSDIINNIYDQLNFKSKINLKFVTHFFAKYPITNLLDAPYKKLTNDILKLYPLCIKLNIFWGPNMPEISHLTNLQVLYANTCGIRNCELKVLTNLTQLDVSNNERIVNLNRLTNLKILRATNIWSKCGVDSDGISALRNLTELDICGNKNITNLNHLVNLRTLDIGNGCRINYEGISTLTNLTKLSLRDDCRITHIDHLINLTDLDISDNSKISDISSFINLRILRVNRIHRIYNNYVELNICNKKEDQLVHFNFGKSLVNKTYNINGNKINTINNSIELHIGDNKIIIIN